MEMNTFLDIEIIHITSEFRVTIIQSYNGFKMNDILNNVIMLRLTKTPNKEQLAQISFVKTG